MSNESYLVVPHEIYTDSNLRHFDKLLFGKIYSLSRQKGYCWSSNSYFAKELNVSTRYVSNSINRLKEFNYIYCIIDNSLKNELKRKIYINNAKLKFFMFS